MQNHFLCPTHRQWLNENVIAAVNHYHSCLDTGQFHRDGGNWSNAIPYYGCAFETAEILLTLQQTPYSHTLLQFTHSAILLCDSLGKSNYLQQRQQHFILAKERLRKELARLDTSSKHMSLLLDCYAALELGLKQSTVKTTQQNEQQNQAQQPSPIAVH